MKLPVIRFVGFNLIKTYLKAWCGRKYQGNCGHASVNGKNDRGIMEGTIQIKSTSMRMFSRRRSRLFIS